VVAFADANMAVGTQAIVELMVGIAGMAGVIAGIVRNSMSDGNSGGSRSDGDSRGSNNWDGVSSRKGFSSHGCYNNVGPALPTSHTPTLARRYVEDGNPTIQFAVYIK
jgi:hypothetical protein